MGKRVLSGMRPTGKLHLGHWLGALSQWVELQKQYQCFFMVADWHALMSEYSEPSRIKEITFDNLADWLAWGITPEESIIFIQSEVPQHSQLFLHFSMFTPLARLFRCPTFKEQINQLKDKKINTYAFLGYPVLQAVDILIYKANYVPVGEDQLPHLELTREIARKFKHLYKSKIFPQPQPLLTKVARLPGVDGRKMSNSYKNFIALDEEPTELYKKVISMFTDPARIRKSDAGHPEVCKVYDYYRNFAPDLIPEVQDWCRGAKKGCKDCKKDLAKIIDDFISPKRERKRKIVKDEDYLKSVLEEGTKKARAEAERTMAEVDEAVWHR
jgi:tryptophanyl-tRNA synthetase